jgi:hypothetical protein
MNLPSARTTPGRYRAYGVELLCDFPLPSPPARRPEATVGRTIEVRRRGEDEVRAGWRTDLVLHEATLERGVEVKVERGVGGEHLVRHGAHAFRLSADLRRMLCAPPAEPDPAWESALLDWAPYATAVLAETECLHAGAVRLGGRVVAIAAPSGAGKSTLVAALVAAGATFFSDDVLALARRDELVIAHPGAPFSRLGVDRGELAAKLGTIRAEVDEELWVEIPGDTAAAPLAAMMILHRLPDEPPTPRFAPTGFADLRVLSLGFTGAGGGEARRLGLLAELASQAQVLRLEVNESASPEALAEALATELGRRP